MPRGRPRQRSPSPISSVQTDDEEDDNFDPTFIVEEVQKKLKICSQHLSQNYFEMARELNKDLECSVCLEKLNCKSCFTILSCGHSFHGSCLVRIKEKECPTCRDHSH